eukprot:jgi/Galph1/712/GphlegSOOS_G5543.1
MQKSLVTFKPFSRRNFLRTLALCSAGFVVLKSFRQEALSENIRQDIFKTPSGIEYIDFEQGVGDKPEWGDMVVIHYVLYTVEQGKLRKFYSTFDDKQPFAFRHGNGQTIKGLEEAVDSMRVRGRRRMVIPHALGYSVAGLGPIPPSTWVRTQLGKSLAAGNVLVLDVELLKIWKDPDGIEYYTDIIPDVSKTPRSVKLEELN